MGQGVRSWARGWAFGVRQCHVVTDLGRAGPDFLLERRNSAFGVMACQGRLYGGGEQAWETLLTLGGVYQ